MTTRIDHQVQFDIVYEGPAVAEGTMNVRDLAPAMLAVGEVFESANRVANGDRATINVNVRATSQGSFEILFEVVQTAQQVGLDPDLIKDAIGIKELLIGGGGIGTGLFALMKFLRGRRPNITRVNDGLYTLRIDGETYEVPVELLRQYQDASVRNAIGRIVRPVGEPGIDQVQIRENDQVIEEVTKDHLPSFEAPASEELLLDDVRTQAVSIVSLAFKNDNKWRLTDGSNTFSVSMKDDAFRSRVDSNEVAFAKSDVLVCNLRTIQWLTGRGVKTEYEVIRVVEHRSARQLDFFGDLDTDQSGA